jgi:uncharacterized membrane protein
MCNEDGMQRVSRNPNLSLKSQGGNITIPALVLIVFFAFVFLALSDFCRIFIARSETKKAADSAALAVSQNLLFFDVDSAQGLAKNIVEKNDCRLSEVSIGYDQATVFAKKEVKFIFLKFAGFNSCEITSYSKAAVLYPWDESLGLCKSYRFGY